jgi:hypothetical protein
VANLLEWVLDGYLAAFATIDRELDEFDAHAMEGQYETPEQELAQLVDLRREIGRLRRAQTALDLTAPPRWRHRRTGASWSCQGYVCARIPSNAT